uniref:FAS-associated death domain protein n=1 Tax=Camelus bactrianus TaxID=9837 RepID=A0A9W3ESH1_CAMBA
LSSSELTELKFLCQSRVGKRKLERVQSGLDLFSVLLEQNELSSEHTVLLRITVSFPSPDLRAAFDIICDNVGKDWRRLARQLKVSDAKIDAIEEKYPRNLAEQVRESLRVWRNSRKEDAAVSHLVGALRACRLNLVADLVEEDQQARARQSQSERGGDPAPLESRNLNAPTSRASS